MKEFAQVPDEVTIGDKYDPAMEITTQEEADAYFALLVARAMRFGRSREEAESIERQNLGWYAGYYGSETRARVERLFACAHPIFGAIAERGARTSGEVFAMGAATAHKMRLQAVHVKGMQEGGQ